MFVRRPVKVWLSLFGPSGCLGRHFTGGPGEGPLFDLCSSHISDVSKCSLVWVITYTSLLISGCSWQGVRVCASLSFLPGHQYHVFVQPTSKGFCQDDMRISRHSSHRVYRGWCVEIDMD